MGYRLGIDLGTSFTAATIGRAGAMVTATLEAGAASVPSAVFVGRDGERRYGSAALERAVTDPGRVLRGFVRRIGDETPMLPGEPAASSAHRLAADFVTWVVSRACEQEGCAPEAVAVTHPGTWGPHKRDLLLGALTAAGVPNPALVAEPVAAAAGGEVTPAQLPGATVAVYDLGGRTFDTAIVRLDDAGRWTVIGRPAGLPDLGGADLDDAVLAHVIAGLPPLARRELADALAAGADSDSGTAAGMAALRLECVRAKEALSSETSASVAVTLPGVATRVRLTRSELETLITPALEATLDVLDATLSGAGLVTKDLTCVLVSGGSGRIPLVTQLLSRQFGVPVVSAGGANPTTALAAGAVRTLDRLPAAKLAAVPSPAHVPVAGPATPIAAASPTSVATPSAAAPAPVADAPGEPVPSPVAAAAPSTAAGGGKPIRPRRPNRRAGIVGLEGLAAVVRAVAETAPAADGPRSVVAARPVRSVDALLSASPCGSARGGVALASRPSATVVAEPILRAHPPALSAEEPMPPRPALAAGGFEERGFDDRYDDREEAPRGSWTFRSLVTVRRSVAVSTLTLAIYLGATAWVPATPAITAPPTPNSASASAEHHTTP